MLGLVLGGKNTSSTEVEEKAFSSGVCPCMCVHVLGARQKSRKVTSYLCPSSGRNRMTSLSLEVSKVGECTTKA